MNKKIFIWACDYSPKTGEGNLARLFVKLKLKKFKSKIIKGPKNFNNNSLYYHFIKYKYMAPIIGVIFCWKHYINNKKVCYLNYLPFWNFLIFLLLPPKTIVGPITGGSFFIVKDFQSLFRRFIFPLFYRLSIFIIANRKYQIIFSTDLLKRYLPNKIIFKSEFNFVFNLFKLKKIKKNKKIFVIYYRKHKNKNAFFPYFFVKKLLILNYRVNIVGDSLEIKGVKNYGFVKKEKLYRILSESKFSILSGENIFSLFTIECINHNIQILVDKKFGYKINYYKKFFLFLNMKKESEFRYLNLSV